MFVVDFKLINRLSRRLDEATQQKIVKFELKSKTSSVSFVPLFFFLINFRLEKSIDVIHVGRGVRKKEFFFSFIRFEKNVFSHLLPTFTSQLLYTSLNPLVVCICVDLAPLSPSVAAFLIGRSNTSFVFWSDTVSENMRVYKERGDKGSGKKSQTKTDTREREKEGGYDTRV